MTGSGLVRRLASAGGALAVSLAAVALPLAGPASAEPDYPPVFNKITASSFVVARTGSISFQAQTFEPGSTVYFAVTAGGAAVAGGSVVADAKGVAVRDIRFAVVGTNVVSFTGTSSKGKPLALSAQISVTAPSSGGDSSDDSSDDGSADDASAGGGIPLIGGIPRTGGEIALTVVVAGALLGGGVLLLATSRRRRSPA